jgi:hypothetical protein
MAFSIQVGGKRNLSNGRKADVPLPALISVKRPPKASYLSLIALVSNAAQAIVPFTPPTNSFCRLPTTKPDAYHSLSTLPDSRAGKTYGGKPAGANLQGQDLPSAPCPGSLTDLPADLTCLPIS